MKLEWFKKLWGFQRCLTHHRPKVPSLEKRKISFAVAQRTCGPLQLFPGSHSCFCVSMRWICSLLLWLKGLLHGLRLWVTHVGHLADSHIVSAPQVLGTNKWLARIWIFMLYIYFCECFSSLLWRIRFIIFLTQIYCYFTSFVINPFLYLFNYLHSFFNDKLDIFIWVLFLYVYYVPLNYFPLISFCLNHHSLVVECEALCAICHTMLF